MATTIITQPNALSPVRDPAWMQVRCDGYLTTPPTAHYTVALAVDPAQPSAGDTVIFTVPDGRSTTLTAVSGTPDDSATQFQIGADTAETFANLLDTLEGNMLVSSLYLVSDVGTYSAKWTSRLAGPGTLLITTTGVNWVSMLGAVAGSNGDLKPNYRLGLAVFVEEEWDSGVYKRLPEFILTPNADQEVSEDVAPLLLPYLKPVWPPMTGATMTRSTDLQKRYYVSRFERYGDPPVARQVVNTTTKQALLGGTRQAEHNSWVAFSSRIRTGGVSLRSPWLTYRGIRGRHEVSPAQRHHLGWYCWFPRVSGEALTLRAKVYYTDGTTTENATSVSNASSLKEGEIGQWPTGFEQLGLDAWSAGRSPYKYEVWITKPATTAVSDGHIFWLAEADANELHLEFVNSLGVVESVRCVGRSVESLDATYTKLTKALLPAGGLGPTPDQAATTQRPAGAQQKLDAFLGFTDEAEHNAQLDIVTSPWVRLIDARRGIRLPVMVVASSHEKRTRGEDGEHLYALALKLEVSDAEMAWSNIVATV